MTPAERYRARAIEFEAKAKVETNPARQAEFEHLARSYRRLAEQADRNAQTDIVYEPPPPRPETDAEGTS
jgi:hypothetical protein